jgi:predicted benzoate:H+ symporter BenE
LTTLEFFDVVFALFDPSLCRLFCVLDVLLEGKLAQLAVDGLALLSALLLTRMLALPDSRAGLVATNVTDFLPTFFHEIVLARERNLLRPFALPSDWR